MDFNKIIFSAVCRLLAVLMLQRPTRGGFLFLASPGYDGLKPAGLWGGYINHSDNGHAKDLYSYGYRELQLPSAYFYDGIRINTLSYDPRSKYALVEVEDIQRRITVLAKGGTCASHGPYNYVPEQPGHTLDTIVPDVTLTNGDNPFFLDSACGWKCGWSGFALYDGRVYFILTAVFGVRLESLQRKIQIRVLNTACDDIIQRAIKYEQIDTDLDVLRCSDHVVDVYEHAYGDNQPLDTWVASPLHVVYDRLSGTRYFLLQLIQKADCDVTMSLVQTSDVSRQTVWVHNVSLPSIYGGNTRIRGFGSIHYRDGMLCWTAAEVLLCGPIAGDQVSLVSMLLPPGAAHNAGICTGDLPLAKVLTGVTVATATPLRVYFGCYSELAGHGGAGLVEVNLSSANEVVKHVYSVTSGGKKVYANGLFYIESLCGSCAEADCQNQEKTTSFLRATTSGVMASHTWLEGSPRDGALTGAAWTLVTTLRSIVCLLLHTILVLTVIL